MAAATYTTDLVDIITDPASTTGWTLISSGGGGANSFTAPETDDYVQGTTSISRSPWSSAIRGMVFNSAQTVAAGDAVFFWTKADVAQALDTKAAGGIQLLIGSGTGALNSYYVDGSDTYTFGGWTCIPIDPTLTPSTTIGAPTATTSFFGTRWSVPAAGPSKGFPFKIDAIRRGRTLQLVGGDLANGYATFTSVAAFQGDITRQWGLFQLRAGTYTQQGLFLMGTAATAVDFRDSNRTIFIANTEYVSSTFNTFEVRNAASRVDWTNITCSSLGTVSRGNFVATNNATINKVGCTFSDMGTFSYLSNTTITDTTFRRCQQITQGGASITGCLISNSVAPVALLASVPNAVTNTAFVSSGTGHAIQITAAGTYSFTDLTFTGYASSNGSTGNESLFVSATSGTVTINVSGGGVPTYRTAGATVVIVASSSVTLTGLKAGSEVRAYLGTDPATATEIDGIESSGTSFTFNQSSAGSAGYIAIFALGFQAILLPVTFTGSNVSIPIQQTIDRVYANP